MHAEILLLDHLHASTIATMLQLQELRVPFPASVESLALLASLPHLKHLELLSSAQEMRSEYLAALAVPGHSPLDALHVPLDQTDLEEGCRIMSRIATLTAVRFVSVCQLPSADACQRFHSHLRESHRIVRVEYDMGDRIHIHHIRRPNTCVETVSGDYEECSVSECCTCLRILRGHCNIWTFDTNDLSVLFACLNHPL